MSAFTKFYFRPGENERISTSVLLESDVRSSIHGIVRESNGRPIADALVLLFTTGADSADLSLQGESITDETGFFVFGPLTAGQLYVIKVYKNATQIRELEIVAHTP